MQVKILSEPQCVKSFKILMNWFLLVRSNECVNCFKALCIFWQETIIVLPGGSTLLCFCYNLCMAELRKQLPCVKNKLSIFVDLCRVVGSVSVVSALLLLSYHRILGWEIVFPFLTLWYQMRHIWLIKLSFIQIAAYPLFGDKLLTEPMLVYWQLDPWE